MSDLQAIADRVEIEALRAEFSDSSHLRDWDRFAGLFTVDGAWRMPHAEIEFEGREAIRDGVGRLRPLWNFFVQNTHPGIIELDGDTATGRAYIVEFGRFHDGSSHLNYSIYHDTYRRTPDGWKFAERRYQVQYYDNTTLTGTVPDATGVLPDLPDGVR